MQKNGAIVVDQRAEDIAITCYFRSIKRGHNHNFKETTRRLENNCDRVTVNYVETVALKRCYASHITRICKLC